MILANHVCLLQIENFDQTTSAALEHFDDHEDLTNYDFDADGVQAPDNDDDKRKLAYRYASRCTPAPVCVRVVCLLKVVLPPAPQGSSASRAHVSP